MVMLRQQEMREMDSGIGIFSSYKPSAPKQEEGKRASLIDEALLLQTDDAQVWKDCANAVARALKTANEKDADKLVKMIRDQPWPSLRISYTVGLMDTALLCRHCAVGAMQWQWLFTTKAAFGTADDLEQIAQGAKQAGIIIDPNAALSNAARPVLLTKNFWHEGNYETTECLFKMGADPRHDERNALFSTVVEMGRKDIGCLFAKYSNGTLNVNTWAQRACEARKMKLYADLREICSAYGDFYVVDGETLQQTKILAGGNSKINVIFNFAASRVMEVFEIPRTGQIVTKDFAFADYGRVALERAHAKLIEMGGNPPALELEKNTLDKPVLSPRLAPKPPGGN